MQLFGLTATEATTAVDVMLCEDANDLARKRGVSTETVRMHVKNVLRKTGMPNQKKLIGLLTRVAALSGLKPPKPESGTP
jgi:DNA-binding CsgD family transcriptional regulator